VACRQRCGSFNLRSNTLEMLEQLVCGNVGQNNSTTHDPTHFCGLALSGFFKAKLCECYDEVAMDHSDSTDFVGKYFSFVERVF
jgi:hypothetical protein